MLRYLRKLEKGPIFLELPLDIQGYTLTKLDKKIEINKKIIIRSNKSQKVVQKSKQILNLINKANRPAILIGAGVDRDVALKISEEIKEIKDTYYADDLRCF